MDGVAEVSLGFSAGLALLGMITHQLKQIIQAKSDKAEAFSLLGYWVDNWPQTLLALVGSTAVVGIAWYMGDLNPVSAYLSGVAGNSAAEVLGSRSAT